MVVLQNCVGFVEGETGSCNETDVKCDFGGIEEFSIKAEDALDIKEEVSIKAEDALDIKEEVSIKVEDAVDIKDETPEAMVFPPIKTEQEVRLCGVCELVAAEAFRPFIARKEILKLHSTNHNVFWKAYVHAFSILHFKKCLLSC